MDRGRASHPSTGSPSPAVVTHFRRVDVLDASLHVVLRGTCPEDIMPASGVALEPELAAEIASVLEEHDFTTVPVAAGLFGETHVWRLVRIGDSAYFASLLERSTIVRRAALLARRFALGEADAELLRLTAGGYSPSEIARRCRRDEEGVLEDRSLLAAKLGKTSAREIIEMLDDRATDDGARVLAYFTHSRAEALRLSSF